MSRPPRVPCSWLHVPCSIALCYKTGRWTSPMPERTVSLDKSGAIARLTLRRPSVDAALLAELARTCDAIESDDSVRVAILAAGGDDFCRGWDGAALAGE